MKYVIPSELTYTVLPGRFCHRDLLPIYEAAFEFWHQNWTRFFSEMKADVKLNADDFFRQDFIPTIHRGDEIVAIHLYTLFDLRTRVTERHSYLSKNFNTEYFESCRKMGFQKVMSMESLFVNSKYRKSQSGLQFGEILIALGQRVFVHKTDADSIIAPARSDAKVSQTACGLGFECLQRDIMLNNTPVDLIICRRGAVTPPTSESRLYVEYLWKNHGDLPGASKDQQAA